MACEYLEVQFHTFRDEY